MVKTWYGSVTVTGGEDVVWEYCLGECKRSALSCLEWASFLRNLDAIYMPRQQTQLISLSYVGLNIPLVAS